MIRISDLFRISDFEFWIFNPSHWRRISPTTDLNFPNTLMTSVFETLSPVEAAVVQSRLEAAQLHASLENELTNIMFGFSVAPGLINSDAGAIHVVVPDEEAAAAR